MSNPLHTLGRIKGGAKRLADVAAILAKYGLAEWLNDSNSGWFAQRLRAPDGEMLNSRSTAERVRLALTELGTTGIKLGQMLSTRPDMLGPKLTDELEKLQADTPPDTLEQVVATIRDELGASPSDLFAEFEDVAIASASIGQVHRATLHTGEEVVVKVMHEGIEAQVRRDLDIMRFLAELMEKHSPALRQYQPVATAKQFRFTLLNEMNFTCEARNLEEFGNNFDGDVTVRFPDVYPEFSSRRVLTMERPGWDPGLRSREPAGERCRPHRVRAPRGERLPRDDLPRWILPRRPARRERPPTPGQCRRSPRRWHGRSHRRDLAR